jgi:hypothetical protein
MKHDVMEPWPDETGYSINTIKVVYIGYLLICQIGLTLRVLEEVGVGVK